MDSKEGKRISITGSPVKILESNSTSNSESSSDESLNLTMKFKPRREYPIEVQPINKERRCTYFCYGRVITEKLTKGVLKQIFQDSHADIDIIEEDDAFILQYKNQKPISLSKQDGKFYSYSDGMNQQARIIWEILRKHGYVENPQRKYFYHKESMWKE